MGVYLSLLFSTAADLVTNLENAFQGKIDAAYFETSKYLLDVLNKKYSLLEHMQAMRRYLLLGQGDFIRHLMDLLKWETPSFKGCSIFTMINNWWFFFKGISGFRRKLIEFLESLCLKQTT